jgi:outer membrane lipoprotein-sorting protein
MLLLGISSIVPGCVNSQETRFTPVDMAGTFFSHADLITDYQSEYTSTSDGTVRFDWKAPALYRMEYTGSSSVSPGTIITMNRTTAVWYDARQKTYRVEPEIRYLREHDYQAMVRQIVQDGQYTIIGRDTRDGHTLYGIEVLTEPWSTKYTTSISSKVQAWIDPESGLAWNITTFYPADTVNNVIRYNRIVTNTGISDDHFAFTPIKETAVTCDAYSPASQSRFDLQNVSAALLPGCTNCTGALLTRPVGGFNGNDIIISLMTWKNFTRVADPHPTGSIRYTFYSREMSTGTVKYRISRVKGLYETEAMPMPDGVAVSIVPDEISPQPGKVFNSTVTVSIDPEKFSSDDHQFWIYLHAAGEGSGDIIADDWVRVAVSDGDFMMGVGHFHTSGGSYCQKLLVVRPGEIGHLPFMIRTGERDTGNVTLGLVTSPCIVDHGPLRPDERPVWPEGIRATITPDQFTGRSFATYLPDMSFDISPEVSPGDYCFSAVLRTPTGGSEFAPFTLRVVSGGS